MSKSTNILEGEHKGTKHLLRKAADLEMRKLSEVAYEKRLKELEGLEKIFKIRALCPVESRTEVD